MLAGPVVQPRLRVEIRRDNLPCYGGMLWGTRLLSQSPHFQMPLENVRKNEVKKVSEVKAGQREIAGVLYLPVCSDGPLESDSAVRFKTKHAGWLASLKGKTYARQALGHHVSYFL